LNVFKCNVVYININKHIYNYRDQKIGLKVETSISRGSKQKIVLNFNYRGSIFPFGSAVDLPHPPNATVDLLNDGKGKGAGAGALAVKTHIFIFIFFIEIINLK
jgi:hypothetical protein